MNDAPWPLPASWRWCRFDEVARVASNLVDPADFLDWPHIAPNHIESETGRLLPHHTIAHDAVTSPKHRFSAGQVLYSKIRPYLAKAVVAEFDGLCSADMYPVESVLDSRFLKWWMLSREFTRRAAGEQARTVLPKINVRALSGLPVPVPPLPEQIRIVEILEDHLSRLDAGVFLLTDGQRRLEAWKRVILDRLVQQTASGTTSLGSLLERLEAGRSLGGSAPPAGPGEWGIIKVSAMTWGEFRPQENKKIATENADPRYQIRPGDVLMSRANTTEYVGAPVYVERAPERLLLSDKSLRLVPKTGVDGRWLASVLASRSTRAKVSELATGTKDSMRNISQQSLLSLSVPQATPEQQSLVVRQARELADGAGSVRMAIDQAQFRGSALRRALLVAAFSGRLVP